MTNTSCFNHLRRGGALLAIATALAAVTPAVAQTSTGNAARFQEGGYSTVDLSAFFGWQWFQFGQGSTVRPLDFRNGMIFGARRFTPHFSQLVAEFARIPMVVHGCRNSGEFRYERIVGTASPSVRNAG